MNTAYISGCRCFSVVVIVVFVLFCCCYLQYEMYAPRAYFKTAPKGPTIIVIHHNLLLLLLYSLFWEKREHDELVYRAA